MQSDLGGRKWRHSKHIIHKRALQATNGLTVLEFVCHNGNKNKNAINHRHPSHAARRLNGDVRRSRVLLFDRGLRRINQWSFVVNNDRFCGDHRHAFTAATGDVYTRQHARTASAVSAPRLLSGAWRFIQSRSH